MVSLRRLDAPKFQCEPQEVSVFMQVKPQICSHEERPASDFLQLTPSLQPLLTSALYTVTAEIVCACVCVLLLVGSAECASFPLTYTPGLWLIERVAFIHDVCAKQPQL